MKRILYMILILQGLSSAASAKYSEDSTKNPSLYFKLKAISLGVTHPNHWNHEITDYSVFDQQKYESQAFGSFSETQVFPGLALDLFFEMKPSLGLSTSFNYYSNAYGHLMQFPSGNIFSRLFVYRHFQFTPTIYKNVRLTNKLLLQLQGGLSFNFHRGGGVAFRGLDFYSSSTSSSLSFSRTDMYRTPSALRVLPAFGSSIWYRFNTDYLKLEVLMSGVGLNPSESHAISDASSEYRGRRMETLHYADNLIISLSYVRTINWWK